MTSDATIDAGAVGILVEPTRRHPTTVSAGQPHASALLDGGVGNSLNSLRIQGQCEGEDLNLHGSNPASTSTQGDAAKSAEVLAFTLHGSAQDREPERAVRGRNRGRVVVLSDRRQLPRPRVQPTTDGAVHLTFGTGDHEREEHLELRDARALLNELADAIDLADYLARLGREADRG